MAFSEAILSDAFLTSSKVLQLLMRVAQGVLDLSGKPTGMNMLKKFLGLEARDAE